MATSTIAITGSNGLIGAALGERLRSAGHNVLRIVRREAQADDEVAWDIQEKTMEAAKLEGIDAVVHLAGEPVVGGRWTETQMKRIRDSRIDGTALLARTLASLDAPPHTLVSASAIGYYGNRADETLDENAPPGETFLADVCRDWEGATEPARQAGIRVVTPRIGVVMDPSGGALRAMLPAFRLGLGGPVGSGRQWVSWIALEDLTRLIERLALRSQLSGPVNAVAPHPVRNAEMAHAIAHALRRPAFLRAPVFALRLLLGRMADETLLASTRVVPTRALDDAFQFEHPRLESLLACLLK